MIEAMTLNFNVAEQILIDIENVINKNSNVTSFDIIPAENNNKSPVIQGERSLGLASWCIQPLYCYVYSHLLEIKRNQCQQTSTCISRWLLGALLLNPDICTFWNMRRKLIQDNKLDPINDLYFVNIVIYHKPQCFEAFSYRRWLLQLILNVDKSITDIRLLLRNEYEIITAATTENKHNCFAWTHRTYITSIARQILINTFFKHLHEEWEQSTVWCQSHISDSSVFAYRQFILKYILVHKASITKNDLINCLERRQKIIYEFISVVNEGYSKINVSNRAYNPEYWDFLHVKDYVKYLGKIFGYPFVNLSYWAEDCLLNEELINIFPEHETLWYHRRFLIIYFLILTKSFTRTELPYFENSNSLEGKTSCNVKIKENNLPLSIETSLNTILYSSLRIRNRKLISFAKNNKHFVNCHGEKFSKFLIRNDIKP